MHHKLLLESFEWLIWFLLTKAVAERSNRRSGKPLMSTPNCHYSIYWTTTVHSTRYKQPNAVVDPNPYSDRTLTVNRRH